MSEPGALAELPAVDVWLVDGFNVLHAVLLGGADRGQFWSGPQRDLLIARLAVGLATGTPIVLVFDGRRPVTGDEAQPAPGIELVFAPSADDWIVKRARRAATADEPAERVGVVSNDRKVVGRCRHAGAAVVAPNDFMAHFPSGTQDEAGGADGAGS